MHRASWDGRPSYPKRTHAQGSFIHAQSSAWRRAYQPVWTGVMPGGTAVEEAATNACCTVQSAWDALARTLPLAWTVFGATPILCAYVATLVPRPGMDADARRLNEAALNWDDVYPSFLVYTANALVCMVCNEITSTRSAGCVSYMFCVPPPPSSSNDPQQKKQWDAQHVVASGFMFVAATLRDVLNTYSRFIFIIASNYLFFISCQPSPEEWVYRYKTNGTIFSDEDMYQEFRWALPLIALSRMALASFVPDRIEAHRSSTSQPPPPQRTWVRVADYVLSLASIPAYITLCSTVRSRSASISPNASRGETLFVRFSDSFVGDSTRWRQYLFLIGTSGVYLGSRDIPHVHHVLETAVKAVALVVGQLLMTNSVRTSLHSGDGGADRTAVATTCIENYTLRSWASDGALQNALFIAWTGLLSIRCLVEACSKVAAQLRDAHLDMARTHAPDLDDIFFATSIACAMSAAFAASPSTAKRTTDMNHTLTIATVLLVAGTSCMGAAFLHMFVGVVKEPWKRRARYATTKSPALDASSTAVHVDKQPQSAPAPTTAATATTATNATNAKLQSVASSMYSL